MSVIRAALRMGPRRFARRCWTGARQIASTTAHAISPRNGRTIWKAR